MENREKRTLTVQTLQRLPYYLEYLRRREQEPEAFVSATTIAAALNLNEVQVRKDLAAVSSTAGKPRTGFSVQELISDIEDYLGYNNVMDAVLVGAGALGQALLSNTEFERYGLHIVAAFDVDPDLCGKKICGKQIFSLSKLPDLCRRMHVNIGIITVPAEAAQHVCDTLVQAGIRAVWNFALIKLQVPDSVLLQNENLAASLASLSQHLRNELKRKEGRYED